MGLFDKKYCDICGQKIGLLGNRKLDDGNLCKDCAHKLSPFFSERRSSTVEMIRQQLDYREANRAQLDSLHPDIVFGQGRKIYIDRSARKFVVTRSSDFRSSNPDIIDFSQVMNVGLHIQEHKDEVYTKDKEGKRISYNPPRFKIEYEFEVTLAIDSPWFSEIRIELSEDHRPSSRIISAYHELEDQGRQLKKILTGPAEAPAAPVAPVAPVEVDLGPWTCPGCNAGNTGKFCEYCGTPRP